MRTCSSWTSKALFFCFLAFVRCGFPHGDRFPRSWSYPSRSRTFYFHPFWSRISDGTPCIFLPSLLSAVIPSAFLCCALGRKLTFRRKMNSAGEGSISLESTGLFFFGSVRRCSCVALGRPLCALAGSRSLSPRNFPGETSGFFCILLFLPCGTVGVSLALAFLLLFLRLS